MSGINENSTVSEMMLALKSSFLDSEYDAVEDILIRRDEKREEEICKHKKIIEMVCKKHSIVFRELEALKKQSAEKDSTIENLSSRFEKLEQAYARNLEFEERKRGTCL